MVYLDDVIVFGQTFDEQIERLALVFDQLRNAGLKLKPKKCNFFKKRVPFLGHVVSNEGISTDPEKIRVVKEWPIPKTITEVRSFLGLASYYRRFIKSFAHIAKPLHKLTSKANKFEWNDECQESFLELKDKLIESPILAYPLEKGRFILDTDACDVSIGAVLSQEQDGVEKVISYASRS